MLSISKMDEIKIVRTDSELECPALDDGLRKLGNELVLLPDGIDEEELAREARDSLRRLRESEAQLPRLSDEEAMVETFVVGGAVLRQLIRHPLLPAEILDPEPLETLLAAMKRYDEIGRRHWAGFLAGHDVPHIALPLDTRQAGAELAPAPR